MTYPRHRCDPRHFPQPGPKIATRHRVYPCWLMARVGWCAANEWSDPACFSTLKAKDKLREREKKLETCNADFPDTQNTSDLIFLFTQNATYWCKKNLIFYAKMNGDKIEICNKHLRWIARRAGWTSLGIKGSGRSRKNSLSKVATSCTPVSMESVICPPRSNSSRNCVFCQKRRSSNETSEHFLCCLTFATTLIVKLHLVILSPHETFRQALLSRGRYFLFFQIMYSGTYSTIL